MRFVVRVFLSDEYENPRWVSPVPYRIHSESEAIEAAKGYTAAGFARVKILRVDRSTHAFRRGWRSTVHGWIFNGRFCRKGSRDYKRGLRKLKEAERG